MTMYAMTNGVKSRPTNFKLMDGIAETLSLVGTLENGKITKLDWKNDCINEICIFEDCKETKF